MLDAELEQLQQTEGTPIAISRNTVLMGVTPDPLLVEMGDLELTRLLTLLPRMEVRGGLLKNKKTRGSRWEVASAMPEVIVEASSVGVSQAGAHRH